MSGDTFNIGLSALLASQRGLATTGHNIANVNTAGYSRQRVTFETREPQFIGVGFAGKGVDIQSITRVANDFLVDQLRIATSNQAQADKTVELIDQVDTQIGDALISSGIQSFFNSIGDANNDPRLMATRQVVVESARATVSRFQEQEEQLNGLSRSVNRQMTGIVDKINGLTDSIARINKDIALGAGLASGVVPNDLLDKRDQLLVDLSKLVGVSTQQRSDGMVNVLIGDGQLVVTGGTSQDLLVSSNLLDASRTEVSFNVANTVTQVTSSISGGELGALVAFRDGSLEPARNSIGQMAATFAMAMNEQHRKGMDLRGNLGGDMFSIPPPVVNSPASNTGNITAAFDLNNVGGLTNSDYRLNYDGSNYTLYKLTDGSSRTFSGAGPVSVDGGVLTVTTPPAAGDSFLIQPTKAVPRAMKFLATDPATLAMSAPNRTSRANSNISDATISRAEVLDETNAALLTTTTLVFDNPPTSYKVNGVGASVAFTNGGNIDLNGWRVQIAGAPAAGDTFTVQSNAGGVGDNTNGIALSKLQAKPILEGGTATLQEVYGVLTGVVGAAASQAHVSSQALGTLTENAAAARDAMAGVNLEEEAANLLRFQQAFQAAAQVIKAADQAFQAIINATRG
ncbi:MAG: flagellar hook-associated protein FlgK [Gammaproteobacteria bacterium]|nr:flagellar hook-associated protein FlgK [Gammaproteobacteria bacterium]